MEKIKVTKATLYKERLFFMDELSDMDNVSYHLQYLEFSYVIKLLHKPELTTLSLLNKTIIVETASIIETILDDALRALEVFPIHSKKKVGRLVLRPNLSFDEFFNLAESYKIIHVSLKPRLSNLFRLRSKIHFKRQKNKEPKEYSRYTDQQVGEAQSVLKDFLEHMQSRYIDLYSEDKVSKGSFPYPWEQANTNELVMRRPTV